MIPGHWVDCINPFNNPVNHSYYQHIPPILNELAKICSVCWFRAGHQKPIYVPTRERPKNSRIDSKPERDSL